MTARRIDRRHFLGSAGATAAFLAMHDFSLAGAQTGAAPQPEPGRPRILSLELLTGANMNAMKTFYGKTLDLRIMDERADRFSVEAGETRLTFVTSADVDGGRAPFYHFAFTIPANKILQALEWQKARTPLLAIPERNRAAGYPAEVVDYRHWNAHSIFFLDPAGNVLEYIARHDLKNDNTARFDWGDLLYISEIGVVVDDVPEVAGTVREIASLPQYKGGDAEFTAVGDEYGLVLVMKRGRVVDFTGDAEHGVRVYGTSVNLRGAKSAKHQLKGYPYSINIEERCSCA